MAVFKNDPFPGTDYAHYLEWEKVTIPSGETYYIVPGHPGYVFDPVASNATGRKVFRANPKPALDEADAKKRQQDELLNQQKFNASPTGQLIPVVAGTGGTVVGLWAANHFLNDGGSKVAGVAGDKVVMGDGTIINANTGQVVSGQSGAAAQGSNAGTVAPQAPTANAPATTQSGAAAQGAVPGASAPTSGAGSVIGQNVDGTPIYQLGDGSVASQTPAPGTTPNPDGTITNSDGVNVGRWAQGAAGAYYIYQGVGEFKKDKIGGALDVGTGGVMLADAVSPGVLGENAVSNIAGPIMTLKGGYDTYNSFMHGGQGIRSSTAGLGAGIGTIIAPGLGTIAGAAAGNLVGYGLDKLGMFHKTTKQEQEDRWSDTKASPDVIAKYGPGHDFFTGTGGEESRDEKYLTPDAIRYTPDNYNAIPDWEKFTKQQQDLFLNTMLSEGNVREKKGGIYFNDDIRAKEVGDKIRAGTFVPTQSQSQAAASGATAPPPQMNKPYTRPVVPR